MHLFLCLCLCLFVSVSACLLFVWHLSYLKFLFFFSPGSNLADGAHVNALLCSDGRYAGRCLHRGAGAFIAFQGHSCRRCVTCAFACGTGHGPGAADFCSAPGVLHEARARFFDASIEMSVEAEKPCSSKVEMESV